MPDMYFAHWLKRKRTARFETQELARDEVQRLTGVGIGASTWAQWESGSRVPKRTNPKVQTLIDFFGGWEEPVASAATSDAAGSLDLPTVVEALRLQVQVNRNLMARLAAADEERDLLTAETDRLSVALGVVLERLDAVDARLGPL